MQVCVHAAVVYRMHWQVIVPATDKDIQKRRKVELRRVCETQALYEAVTWTEVRPKAPVFMRENLYSWYKQLKLRRSKKETIFSPRLCGFLLTAVTWQSAKNAAAIIQWSQNLDPPPKKLNWKSACFSEGVHFVSAVSRTILTIPKGFWNRKQWNCSRRLIIFTGPGESNWLQVLPKVLNISKLSKHIF